MDATAAVITCWFDDFLVDMGARALFRLDENRVPTPVQIGSRAFVILGLLIDQRGGFVSRQDIMATVWPDVVVEDSNLTVQMSALRRVLDARRSQGSCIQTVPGRGYRFLPQVIHCAGQTASDPLPPEPRANPQIPQSRCRRTLRARSIRSRHHGAQQGSRAGPWR
jgi:DNA-binding winged helix-turn-helix (wHTH) protein